MTLTSSEARFTRESAGTHSKFGKATAGDMVIVGGGIYGVMTALEASRRGLRPLLVERDEFGAATTRTALGILHGGLRYLQQLDLTRFRQSVGERSWFVREFPEFVTALSCMMPLYNRGLQRRSILRLALAINDLLSWDRNAGVTASHRLAPGRLLNVSETMDLFPAVRREGLRGGALWYDVRIADPDRLLLALVERACQHGAIMREHFTVEELLTHHGSVSGVRGWDAHLRQHVDLHAPIVVNCAGPWARQLAARWHRDLPQLFHPSIAFNILLDHPPLSSAALAVKPPQSGRRTYFLLPQGNQLLAGTYHIPRLGMAEPEVRPSDLQAFLNDLNAAVPGLALTPSNVLRLDVGQLPALSSGDARPATRPVFINHAADGGPRGLYSISGVKYTTSRAVAEMAIRCILRHRGPNT